MTTVLRLAALVGATAWMLACGGKSSELAVPAEDDRADAEVTANLRSLPYGNWAPIGRKDRSGVVLDLPGAAPGLNLYAPMSVPEARLMGLDGEVEHRWRFESPNPFQHVELLAGGDLLVVIQNKLLVRLDWDSNVLWTWDADVHHDVAVDEGGDIVVPIKASRTVADGGRKLPILDQELVTLSPDGTPRSRISIYGLFADRLAADQFDAIRRWMKWPAVRRRLRRGAALGMNTPPDVFHLNSVEIVPRDVPGVARRGDLLIAMRHIDLVAVIDRAGTTVRWAWGSGVIDGPHNPSLLDDGHILLFDNGWKRKWSRALEIVPPEGRIVWSYPSSPERDFYSETRGATQRLANGDTLITLSDSGRVIEVAPDGAIVWDFLVPDTRESGKEGTLERAVVYRMRRYAPQELEELGVVEKLRHERRRAASAAVAGS